MTWILGYPHDSHDSPWHGFNIYSPHIGLLGYPMTLEIPRKISKPPAFPSAQRLAGRPPRWTGEIHGSGGETRGDTQESTSSLKNNSHRNVMDIYIRTPSTSATTARNGPQLTGYWVRCFPRRERTAAYQLVFTRGLGLPFRESKVLKHVSSWLQIVKDPHMAK